MKNETEKTVMRGELALLMVVVLNSLGVLLMLHSGSGISAISSVPYADGRRSAPHHKRTVSAELP